LAIIAITHEFAHGIFMRRYDIKIKSTGFGFFPFFFPVFPAAFVEQDEKSMNKSSRFSQMAVLSAGTFANLLTAVFFFIIMGVFFILAFSPAGIQFNSYSYSLVGISDITSINGINLTDLTYDGLLDSVNETGFNEIKTNKGDYIVTKEVLEKQTPNYNVLVLYDDSPAIKAELEGPIIRVDNKPITSWDDFANILSEKSPGDNITITSLVKDEEINYEIALGESPEDSEKAWLGIGYAQQNRKGVIGKIVNSLSSFKREYIYYKPKFEAALFIYNLLWWLVLISFSVAFVNMLPMGIFDGGRFFYLTILGITGSEKSAKNWFIILTSFNNVLLGMEFCIKSL
jgi:membrane-associated protease RseP (regulator of RpoE activity)